jgi:hypothetical protein
LETDVLKGFSDSATVSQTILDNGEETSEDRVASVFHDVDIEEVIWDEHIPN